jgi:hypothetical protein
MDGHRLDELARRLGALSAPAIGRRRVVALALGALGLAGGSGVQGADASSRCRAGGYHCSRDGNCCTGRCLIDPRRPRHLQYRCACERGKTLCGTRCVELDSSLHCGACNRRCKGDEICCNGACVADDTIDNCGACGVRCGVQQECKDGACVIPPSGCSAANPCTKVIGSDEYGCCDGVCKLVTDNDCCGDVCDVQGGSSCTAPDNGYTKPYCD